MTASETPRIGVFVCHCGTNIGGVVNVPEVVEHAKTLPDVVHAERNLYTCSSEGLYAIKEAIDKNDLNRIVVASCTPRTHESLFRGICEEAGLNKYLFQMANIREHCSWVHMHEPEKATEKAKDIVRMAVAKARLLQPQVEPEIEVKPSAMIIGGGIAGMTAASCLGSQGFKVHLIEKEPEIGGMLRRLNRLYPTERKAANILDRAAQEVRSNENVDVLTSATVKAVKGFIGNFEATVKREKKEPVTIGVGTIIVATGAKVLQPEGMYGYGEHENVTTQLELEHLLQNGQLKKPGKVVMIQCVGAREEEGRTYCSRICCTEAVKNAMLIKDLHPDAEVYVLFRDLATYGKEYEECYWKAREKGVKFTRYIGERPPEITPQPDGKLRVRVYHAIFGEEITIDSDLTVLSTPLVPQEDAVELSRLLKVPLGPHGFFSEAHIKLRPVDFATDGIYVCGTAHSPKDVAESIAQAYAAASRAAIPMASKKIRTEALMSVVDEDLCIGCRLCEDVCQFGAHVLEGGKSKVIDVLCKGCGVCAAACPQRAITMKHFTDDQITAEIQAALVQ